MVSGIFYKKKPKSNQILMKCDIDPSDKWCWCVVSHRTIPDTQISYNISVNFDTCARTVPASVLVKPGGG